MRRSKTLIFVDAIQVAKKQNLNLLDIKTVDDISIVTLECSKWHKWKSTLDKLNEGEAKCQVCAGARLTPTEKFIKAKGWAYKNKGKCLSLSFVSEDTVMLWVTKEGEEFRATYHEVVNEDKWYGHFDSTLKTLPGVLPTAHKHAVSNGAKCLTTTGGARRQILDWECSEGHHFTARYDELINRKVFCKECKKESQQKNRRNGRKKPKV